MPVSTGTGEKPQSKVWKHAGRYWCVLPNSSGTHLWRLEGTSWTPVLKLSSRTTTKADCKLVGNLAHILLFQGASSQFVSVEYLSTSATYQLWSKRTSTVGLNLEKGVETATIDMDGTGRMWLASDGSTTIQVRYSDVPYHTWSSPITLASDVSTDDIGTVIAMPGKIGVLWSNQTTRRFGFRTHRDGEDPGEWTEDEVPASQSALNVGAGMADDHLNMAVAADGTLYCAVKTSYDNSRYPEIALLVRQPSGEWDDLYEVSKKGTRPIVELDEKNDKVIVIYTAGDTGGDILYRESMLSSITFSSQMILMSGGAYNNSTSTKDNFSEDVVILASTSKEAVGVLASNKLEPLPVELFSFEAKLVNDDVVLKWITASEKNNEYFSIEASTDGHNFISIGTVPGNGTTQVQSRYTFTDKDIFHYNAAQVYYRLRQVDYSGEATLSPVRFVQSPALAKGLSLQVFPNPFKYDLQVQIGTDKAEPASLTLYNAQGKVLLSQQPLLKVGQNHILLNELPLAQGIYFLSVRTASQQRVVKLVRE
ncbi:T9SS type A sorting domain-containing protein [Pontibacter ruber]|uniref:T9SS type A sorting domain-containing protein n=1 Tax=Pontibacter ruber TaxID=1343895 RepID=A0ABW5CXL6_9BACT|nr:T9SS type A sorting domain-containing protein [Pontibacter ruber]